MLEGAIARILNQILGKYVVDLDTENLNVGIFSGRVQLTDLKLNPEALYELDVPIQVIAGTIGRISIKIPWNTLWDQTTIIEIDDLFILANPIINGDPYDENKNKRLKRAQKRKTLYDLDSESHFIGGPSSFSEHLISNILNNVQLNINNIHIRYEDATCFSVPISLGVCIGNISAQTTNDKWKSAPQAARNESESFYLIKAEAISTYLNVDVSFKKWNFPTDYYTWKNLMSTCMKNYEMPNEKFDFILKPTNCKFKIRMTKSDTGNVQKIFGDLIVQDFHLQLTEFQHNVLFSLFESFERMQRAWDFILIRPHENILKNSKLWWKYAYSAVLQQSILPYTWKNVAETRKNYRNYMEIYKGIIDNPNDTELKLDLQKYEDKLSLVNIVIARQQARLQLKSRSVNEKNFWSMLTSPDRLLLCEKIGFFDKSPEDYTQIEYKFEFRVGNLNFILCNNNLKEICNATMTQINLYYTPNYIQQTEEVSLKVEGFLLDGATDEDQMVTLISSEHLSTSPAYFLSATLIKFRKNSNFDYKLQLNMDSVEAVYNKGSLNYLQEFFKENFKRFKKFPSLHGFSLHKLRRKWDFQLDVKVPFLVIPDSENILKTDNVMIIDLGKHSLRTEISQNNEIDECATQMELEETLFTKFTIESSGVQAILCRSSDNWREAKNEIDSDLHVVSKFGFKTTFAFCVVQDVETLPDYKLNLKFSNIKINLSERNIENFLNYFKDNTGLSHLYLSEIILSQSEIGNAILKVKKEYLMDIQNKVTISKNLKPTRKIKTEKVKVTIQQKQKISNAQFKGTVDENWARTVDLPGLEDNMSPTNNIKVLARFFINEVCVVFSKSSHKVDRQYLTLRIGQINTDLALMTYGPAYQLSINSISLTDKLHTTPSGQYLDIIYSRLPSSIDILTILYRKVSAGCPDFWSHFYGVETSLVADFANLNILLHQESIHTLIKYSNYFMDKLSKRPSTANFLGKCWMIYGKFKNILSGNNENNVPIPPGSVKFSQSVRIMDFNARICDSDFDLINISLSGFEMDFLFRANERFIFRSFLSEIFVEHLSEITLYNKILFTEDKVFELKYVRRASNFKNFDEKSTNPITSGDSFKFHLGQINVTILLKLLVQLQRFVVNLDALPFLRKLVKNFEKLMEIATKTFENNNKIQISLNLCGPILLVPQKTSSPNVLVIDTGHFEVENFYKDIPDETVENILLKWNNITVTRGVMMLTSTLENQETLVEPFQLNFDIKKISSKKRRVKTWEIDGVLNFIEVTLGQRDLQTILSIYAENIDESKLISFIPKSKLTKIDDESVESLQVFFAEAREKIEIFKFNIDEIKLSLFFDSSELLSSPIRDLNHGMCKFEIFEIHLSFSRFNDNSLDGKVSIEQINIQEMGPDSSKNKNILQSSNFNDCSVNSNIKINKPPIVDMTFHLNQTGDKSIDVIVGKLVLNISLSLCEKFVFFIMDCAPKDNEMGVINYGYDGELPETTAIDVPAFRSNEGITVSFRLNKPEVHFSTEDPSKFFKTKCEVLVDYSQHSNRSNFAISLSGLHTVFHNGKNERFTLLRHCDMEFCKSISEENSASTSVSISSIYLKIYEEIAHVFNEIYNGIMEHFKGSTTENVIISNKIKENLWEPKTLEPFMLKSHEHFYKSQLRNSKELFIVPKFEIILILEIEKVQAFVFKSTIELTAQNLENINSTTEITIQANYFNENSQNWEPFIDPIVSDGNHYRPWNFVVKIFQDKPFPVLETENVMKRKKRNRIISLPTTEDEECDSGEDMMFLEPINNFPNRNKRVKSSLSTFLEDSDSENEDGNMEKLAAAISNLFTGDWNENEDSECEISSDGEDSEGNGEHFENDFISSKKSTYFLIDSKENLNITITPTLLKLLNLLFSKYSEKAGISVVGSKESICLTNNIGPDSKIELHEKTAADKSKSTLICSKTFEIIESAPNSPTKTINSTNFENEAMRGTEESYTESCESSFESYDLTAISSLQFPEKTTSELYEKIDNSDLLKIYTPNFHLLQTNCSGDNWTKLLKLQQENPNQYTDSYCLIANHSRTKNGRSITIGSPLYILNKTCHAINVLYQPSVLQQLNLEPVGDVTNPFETTMRIAILEPHEEFNVPLFIAYHCKIFLQPAYAEGNFTAVGVWWKDLIPEIEISLNLVCKLKENSQSSNVFAMRISMKENSAIKSPTHALIPNYSISILPPLIIENDLPFTIILKMTAHELKIEPSEKFSLYNLDITHDVKMNIEMKIDAEAWCGNFTFTPHLDEKFVALSSGDNRQTALNIKAEKDESFKLFIYSTYWIVNKTGLPLKIKTSSNVVNTLHSGNSDEILLLTYKRHGKHTLSLRVYDSNWSNEFGLECAGTTGLVVCKDPERKKKYMFFLKITLSEMCPKFTKIVTILPSFLIRNNTQDHLRIMEENEKTDLWIDLAPSGQTIKFWPETSSMRMYLKHRQGKIVSQPFHISSSHRTVLRIDKGSAIVVEVTGGITDSFKIIFQDHSPGDAPVLIRNYCDDVFLKIQQKEQGQVTLVNPYHCLLYTWDDPTGLRQLVWNVYNNKETGFVLDISKDGYGDEKIRFRTVTPSNASSSSDEDSDSSRSVKTLKTRKDKLIVYWSCFKDGAQRVLMFTQEFRVRDLVLTNIFHEKSNVDVLISMSGISLSVFPDEKHKKEKFQVTFNDSPSMWEVNVGHKWKTLTLELASWIEEKYKAGSKKCQLKECVHIDFEKMFMLKPFFAELRRTYTPAIFFNFRMGESERYLDFRVNSIQIDDKWKKIAATVLRTCNSDFFKVEISKKGSTCRFFNVNVGEFSVNLEDDLWIPIDGMLQNLNKITTFSENDPLVKDMAIVHNSLEKFEENASNQSCLENFKLNAFNFQMITSKTQQTNNFPKFLKFLHHFFPANMTPYMSTEGVQLKITTIQEMNLFEDFQITLWKILEKLKVQLLQQYYAHVLGLQVLVNTFATNQTFEQQTFNSTNNAFSPNPSLIHGLRYLLGHVNMSPAALEQSISDIFENQNLNDVVRIKRANLENPSSHSFIRKEMTVCSKNFYCYVPIALDQLIIKNDRAYNDAEMFFRTTGKVLQSLIMKHSDEKINCVDLINESLRRALSLGEPIYLTQRLTRYQNVLLGLKPFSVYESLGQHLLETVGNCRFYNDNYWTHAVVDKFGKFVILVSLEHLIKLTKSRMWGAWELEWILELDDILKMPQIANGKLLLKTRVNKYRNCEELEITGENDALEWLREKIEQAIIVSMEQKSWSLNNND